MAPKQLVLDLGISPTLRYVLQKAKVQIILNLARLKLAEIIYAC